MSVTREEIDAKNAAIEARVDARIVSIERDLKRVFTLCIASIATTVGTGIACTQAMLSHFDTVLEAYHAGARLPQDIRVVTYEVKPQASATATATPQ
jgi:hypothetical protein